MVYEIILILHCFNMINLFKKKKTSGIVLLNEKINGC
jgi:hypothetical protein